MDLEAAMEMGRHALWMALTVSAPVLLVGLVVGLVISLFQAVTQLQEQTLTFVPKIAAMAVAAALVIPWVAEQMVAYAKDMLSSMPW